MAEAPQIPDEAETRARWGDFAWAKVGGGFAVAAALALAAPVAAQSYDAALAAKNTAAANAFLGRIGTAPTASDEAVVYNLKDRPTQSWSKTNRATFAGMIKGCTQSGAIPTIYGGGSGPKYGLLFGWDCAGGRQLQTVVLVEGDAVYRVDIIPAGGQ